MRIRPRRSVGEPLYAVGAALVAYTVYHRLASDEPLLLEVGETAVLVTLAAVIAYGGYRIDRLDLDDEAVLPTVGGVLGAYLFGVVFAGTLIGFQLFVGVPMTDVGYLLVTSGSATAALGVGIVLYYHQVQAERDELARRSEELHATNKRLRLLQRVLRHNLRNEVTVIRGHANLVLDRAVDDDVRSSARAIDGRAARIEQFSDSAHLLRQVWDTDAVVEQDAVTVAERCLAEIRDRHPDATLGTDLPAEAPVLAHPRIEDAIHEAVANAVVHTDGPVTVTVRRRQGSHEDTPGRDVENGTGSARDDGSDRDAEIGTSWVEVAVADTGEGIPDIEVDALDQPEERPLLHSTGLGLWLIYWLVEKSDGELSFDANDPQGTVVRIRLPAAGA